MGMWCCLFRSNETYDTYTRLNGHSDKNFTLNLPSVVLNAESRWTGVREQSKSILHSTSILNETPRCHVLNHHSSHPYPYPVPTHITVSPLPFLPPQRPTDKNPSRPPSKPVYPNSSSPPHNLLEYPLLNSPH